MPFGLPESALYSLIHLFREDPRIKKVWLYGSRSLGTYKTASDIDLTLEAPDLEFRDLAAMEQRIDELLLPWTVDLSLQHHIDNLGLLEHIRSNGIDLFVWEKENQIGGPGLIPIPPGRGLGNH